MRYNCKYQYTNDFGYPKHLWSVEGATMGVHLSITDLGEDKGGPDERYSGGFEYHWRNPPSYMSNLAPSQHQCWVIDGPCWHDGSSLWASEHWIPLWLCHPNDHDCMFKMLQSVIEDRSKESIVEPKD